MRHILTIALIQVKHAHVRSVKIPNIYVQKDYLSKKGVNLVII